jgi:uncharacterized protein
MAALAHRGDRRARASRPEMDTYPARPDRRCDTALVLAHGAGAGRHSVFMVAIARGLAARGVAVATFDFPYMAARRRAPDPGPVLEAAWREAIRQARADPALTATRLVIGGKSMGGRIASQVAARGEAGPLAGVVCLGYPLHPPGRPEQRRDRHLPQIAEPMLFVQGTRDPFGTADEIRHLLPSLRQATLHTIAGGDHSFKVPVRGGRSQAEVMEELADTVAEWIRRLAGDRTGSDRP